MHLRPILLACVALFCVALADCAGVRSGQVAAIASRIDSTRPGSTRFDPLHYFEGPTHSRGIIENRSGEPRGTFRAAMVGVRDRDGRDGLTITQDFVYDDGRKQQRIWHIRRIDQHRYDATANDVIGVTTGYAYGNSFRWEYTLQLKAGNPLTRVRMKHWMILTDDGDTMINRVIISKLGIIVAETTEYFRHGASTAPQ